ncbi:MAG: sialidase family protein [Prolixibacteraceae bacterium]
MKITFISLVILWEILACTSLPFSGYAGERGKEVVLKLTPGTDNPRNSEGDFITLKDGSILFVYTHYTGISSSDHATAYLAGRFSHDKGKSWDPVDHLVLGNEGKMNIMSVSLLRLGNGDIALFYLRKNSVTDCIPMVRFSKDEARTWSEPIRCINDRTGYFVLNNHRVIQLKNGRLLMAVAYHGNISGDRKNRLGSAWSYYSDDSGINWKPGSEAVNPDSVVIQEPGVVELKDGRIMMWMRTNAGVQYQSFSNDGGVNWCPANRSNIISPLSPAAIDRIPKTGDLLLVWNNNDQSDPASKGKRTPQSVAISKDDGITWEKIQNIESDPDGWYCYTAVHFSGSSLLLGYCAGSQQKKTYLSETDIVRIPLSRIYRPKRIK